MIQSKEYLPAFSILEAVVGMVVTAIIMGIIFLIFSIISERMLDFKNQNQYVGDLNRLTYIINKDIFDSEKMVCNDTVLNFISYSGNRTEYVLSESYFLRKKVDFIDTFNLPIKDLRIDTLKSRSERTFYERLSVNVNINGKEMKLKFFKKIYPSELVKSIKNEF